MSTTPGATPKGAATRRRILDAAWDLSDARGAEALLAGVTLRQVADSVDMAPSAVAYHFPTMRELGVAMVEHLADSMSPLPVAAVDALLDEHAGDGLSSAVRAAAAANWQILTTDEEVVFERRLMRSYSAAAHSAEVASSLARIQAGWVADLALIYRRTGERLALAPVEPFDLGEVALAVASMADGLLHHWMCDPERVRHDLMADVVTALTSAVVVPAEQRVELGELSAVHSAPLDHVDVAELAELARLAADEAVFADGLDQLTITDVARSLGRPVQHIAEQYGTVHRMAALSFLRHCPQIATAAARRGDMGAQVSLTDAVYELARCAQQDRHCAIALLHERHHAALDRSPHHIDPRRAVPLDEVIEQPLRQLDRAAADRTAEIAPLVVDTVLSQSASRPKAPVSSVTELALRLVPGL